MQWNPLSGPWPLIPAMRMQPLKSLVASTGQGETSPLHMGDTLTIVKVVETKALPAKPLMEVSADIRRKLAPVKMKDAIKAISAEAKQRMKVEIVGEK